MSAARTGVPISAASAALAIRSFFMMSPDEIHVAYLIGYRASIAHIYEHKISFPD
jgi:hypothetical protein